MAARTLTNTLLCNSSQPKANHVGLNVVAWDLNSGTTKFGTLSDTWLLARIPSGALITDVDIRFGAEGTAAAHFNLLLLAVESGGTTLSSVGTLIASMTASATAATFNTRIPTKLSLSDDRVVQYAYLALNCTTGASETVSFSLQGSIKYLTDGSSLV